MLPQEIIRRKRDGHALSAAEIDHLIEGLASERITEGQVAAFAMAVFFNGMSRAETVALTRAMTASGTRLRWDDLDGPVVDKHSSGGVGDKVSLILAPIIAACGAYVPMISGRGLGHTGGTLDKLDSIPGYVTAPDLARLRRVVREAGCAIIGQTAELAPADRRLYAIRDVSGTVESIAADHRLDPVQEARRRARRAGHGRQGRLRRLSAVARGGARAGDHSGRGRGRRRAALLGAAHRHGPMPRADRGQRARGRRRRSIC